MARYQVHPIADEHCNSVLADVVLLATDDLPTARLEAEAGLCTFGSGILDTETGLLDVGFGWGQPCPEPSGEAA